MKTQLDIYNSATAASAQSLELKTTFEVETAAHEAFRADSHEALDWELFKSYFDSDRQRRLAMRQHPAPSERARKEAAKAAPPATEVPKV